MRHFSLRDVLVLVPAALMLAACGGAPQEGLDSAPEEDSTLKTAKAGLTGSISCSRVSSEDILCTATPAGGVPPYTYTWWYAWHIFGTVPIRVVPEGEGGSTHTFLCFEPLPGEASMMIQPRVQVKDATGATSPVYNHAWIYCY